MKAKKLLREVSPDNQQRLLKNSHRETDEQLKAIIAQLQHQADSTFGGKSWGKAGAAGFGDSLIAHARRLVDLGENFNSGKLPQWYVDQQAAYGNSAIGKTRDSAELRHNTGCELDKLSATTH